MSFDLADRGIYGFATSEHLRFADVDANGHVNNGAFIELLENARVSYLRQIVRSGLPRFRLVIGRIVNALSTTGHVIVAEQSGHGIPLEQPELVIDAVRDLIGANQ